MAMVVGGLFFLELKGNGTHTGNGTDCPDGNQWIMAKFDQCLVSTLQWASFFVGMASILCWVTVLLPQIYSDFKNISNVKSLAWGLLVCWFLGDCTNLTGAFMTKQGLFQTVLGVWFMITDFIIFGQMVFYHCCYKKKEKQKEQAAARPAAGPILCIMGLMSLAATRFLTLVNIDLPLATPSARRGRTLLSADAEKRVPFFSDTTDITGFALGVFSAVAYTASRLFQIYKNYTVRDVMGLDFRTFLLCVLGNWLYGMAVILYSVDHEYLLEHAPWIYGSWGIMFLDSIILYQIRKYDNQFNTLLTHDVDVDQPDDDEAPLLSSAYSSYNSVSIQNN